MRGSGEGMLGRWPELPAGKLSIAGLPVRRLAGAACLTKETGSRLSPVSDATTVRVRGGEVLLGDGPFAETKEQIAGFDVIECADLDEAIEVASKHPVARFGAVELRPFWLD